MIKRIIQTEIEKKLDSGKVIMLIGPRQVGKTTLILDILKNRDSWLFLDGDDPEVRNLLTNPNTEVLKSIIGQHPITFIDEAQRIDNIGITLKIIHDQIKSTQLLVSGSSSFDLLNKTSEPLTGRKWSFELFPVSWAEFEQSAGYLKAAQQLEFRLVYGMYPDVINSVGDEQEVLKLLTDSYLYKDILALSEIRKPEILVGLTKALAHQTGSEVNYAELGNILKVDSKTIQSYISLLEQAFVIYRLPSFSRNLRNEIKTNQKIYFYDNGIRNAVISDFKPWDMRDDKGALWENFLLSERIKRNSYGKIYANGYFWRTKQQQEIDYIEEVEGKLTAFEFKWNPNKKPLFSATFTNNYDADLQLINKVNFREFVS